MTDRDRPRASHGRSGCTISATLFFDMVLEVPVLSLNPGAFVYAVSEDGGAEFTAIGPGGGSGVVILTTYPYSSIQTPQLMSTGSWKFHFDWGGDPSSPTLEDFSLPVQVLTMFPGDTIRIPVEMNIYGSGLIDGTFSRRYEFRTRFPLPAPEPSAALSIPLGAVWLAGLAMRRKNGIAIIPR